MAERYDFYVHDNRKITFNLTEPIMREDSGVTDFVFHIPKILNELEVSDWQWWLVFVNAKKEKYSIALTLSDDPERPLEFNTATYTVDYAMSIKAGSVQFALEAINAGTGGAIDNEWHTLTYETKVKETLQGNQAEYAETESDIISALIQEVRTKMNQIIGGATPAPVRYKAQMTDPNAVYLYIGSEPNEHAGHWYYHNGTQFVSGGVYGAGVTDAIPTQGSTNAVSSGGVYDALHDTDTTLSQSGQAADAAAVGGVKNSVNYLLDYTVIDEESVSGTFHDDENIYGVKVSGSANAFTNILLANKKNLIPDLNIVTETKNGITFSGGGRFWNVSGTSTASASKSTTPDFVSADIPAGTYIVRVYCSGSYTASDNPYFSIVGKKADNSTVTIGSFYLNANPYREWTKTISSDIVSVRVMFAVTNGTAITDTLKLWICMFPSDVTITDTSETVSDGATKTLNIDKSLYPDGIDTMQHESVALYNPKIQKYIRDYVANNVPEDVLTTTEIPYVTPEMFGAIGDYSTDDTIAIQNCINYGITNNLPIKMFSRYKTTSPITVVGELIDLYIHTIENVGSGKGIIITGKRCHIVIDKIISVDDAVTLTTDASHDCSMNIIETTWIASRNGRAIVLTSSDGNTNEFNNEIHSKFLYAPNSNCIYIDSAGVSGGETRFIGNGCLINSGSWAFYISGHNTCRFSGFSMENDAQKGVYCADYNAGGYFDDCRVTEMLDRIDSDANDPEKGLFAKGAGVQNVVINGFDIDYKAVDVSECLSFADRLATGETQPGKIGDMRGVRVNRMSIKRYSDAMAYDEDGITVLSSQCFVPPATKMLVWFDKKYVISPQDTIHDFSADTTIPNCGIIVSDTFAKIIPTIFNIVGTCVINLSDSYNPIANNRIIVLQNTHGATAQIYDSDGTLIFDGATLGDGEYEIISVVNPATTLETSPKHYHLFTGHNMSWLVNKL